MGLCLYNVMESSWIFLFLFLFLFVRADTACNPPVSCNQIGPVIQFPFWRKGQQSDLCGYPGFELSCNNKNQTILQLPFSGEFIVKVINYSEQTMLINDPNSCLPNRMDNFTLSGSRFGGIYSRRYDFYNCSSNWTYNTGSNTMYRAIPISCLSSRNYTVYAVPSRMADQGIPSSCFDINSNYSVPPEWSISRYWTSMNSEGDLKLEWYDSGCWPCEAQGLSCGNNGDNEVGCVNPTEDSKHGLPRAAKYGIIIGVGIPALLLIIGLASHTCSRIRAYGIQRRLDTELSATITPQPVVTITGLDGQTIESYPKTVLGESRRLPKPSDGTCPICLCEYQAKETLRTIPECNHYFHANCIDEWLKFNGTCPLCRNSPESFSVTPCSSMSSSTTSTSS